MKTIKSVLVAVGIGALLLSVGCGSNIVKQVQKLADQACACKDVACAQKVKAKFIAFQKEHAKDKVGKGDQEKLMKGTLRLGQCLANQLGSVPGLKTAGGGSGGATAGPEGAGGAAASPKAGGKAGSAASAKAGGKAGSAASAKAGGKAGSAASAKAGGKAAGQGSGGSK